MKKHPIGIFDSGVGGTSIWQEIHALLPFENTIYLADSKNAPYGHKSKDEIVSLSIKNTEKLKILGAKIIVVACNTATTNAIDILRSQYSIPIVGIEPAIKPAALKTKTKQVGILATKGTLQSSLFSKTSELYANNIQINEVVGEGLVQLIESGKINDLETEILLKSYLDPLIDKKIDYLVLGCSHYPYLIPLIQKLLPKNVEIIDSGEAVAKQTKAILANLNLLNDSRTTPTLDFYTNSNTETLEFLLKAYQKKINISFLNF